MSGRAGPSYLPRHDPRLHAAADPSCSNIYTQCFSLPRPPPLLLSPSDSWSYPGVHLW
ncbi:hypothetical protein DUI70_0657 [Streptomyces albus]|nr:hypothetical protein DUI70_0657 [Streptomyces albus]